MWLFGKEPPPTPLAGDPRVALVSIRIYWLPLPSPTFSPCFLNLSLTQLDLLPRQHSSADCSSNHHHLPQSNTSSNKFSPIFNHTPQPSALLRFLPPPPGRGRMCGWSSGTHGRKSRPGLLLLACPQWSVCCMCAYLRLRVWWGLGESGHADWLASSQARAGHMEPQHWASRYFSASAPSSFV